MKQVKYFYVSALIEAEHELREFLLRKHSMHSQRDLMHALILHQRNVAFMLNSVAEIIVCRQFISHVMTVSSLMHEMIYESSIEGLIKLI